MDEQERWQFDANTDELYERYLVPGIFGPWAQDLIALATPQAGERALDVACGTGIVTRLLAQHVGRTGTVVGLDFNSGRLAVARSLSHTTGSVIEWREGSALALPFPDASFDFVCCQQGLQFFPDRLAALREMNRVLVPGGRLALNVWRSIQHNPGAAAMAEALERYVSQAAGDFRRTPFAFGDVEALRAILTEAGFHDITIRPTVKVLHFPSAEAFVKRYVSSIAPLAAMVAQADDNARAALLREIAIALQPFSNADGLAMPQASNLTFAYR